MKLILHHLAKDIRAQRWLLLLWAFFILVYLGTDLLIIQPGYDIANVGEKIHESPLLSIGFCLVWTFLLVGLIQSEPVIGSTSFWLTRPVPRWVVLPSKGIFILAFLVIPWLATTFFELLLLNVDHALLVQALVPAWWTIGLMVALVWAATFTRTLGGFLLVTGLVIPATVVVFGVRQIYWLSHVTSAHYQLNLTQTTLFVCILLAGLVVSIFLQQLIRKTQFGLKVALGSVLLALLAGFFWPIALPTRLTLLNSFAAMGANAQAQKTTKVEFAPGWAESLTWSQPPKPGETTTTIQFTNGSTVTGANFSTPVSTTDDEGNPVTIGAIVASAQLATVTTFISELPAIESVEASFKSAGGPEKQLPRRDYFGNNTPFNLVSALQSDLPGTTVDTSTGNVPNVVRTPLFKLDAENLTQLRGKKGELTLHLVGHVQTLKRQAAIPLDGTGCAPISGGVIHAHFTTRQTQSLFGIDLPLATKDKPMLAVWQMVYQPALSAIQAQDYYVLVDTTTHAGVILSNANSFSHRMTSGSWSLRASWTEYLTLSFDPSSKAALAHKVLYIYTTTPGGMFTETLKAPNFTMSPP